MKKVENITAKGEIARFEIFKIFVYQNDQQAKIIFDFWVLYIQIGF